MFTKQEKKLIFEDALSWIVVFAMLVYGAGKWIQFENIPETTKTVYEMTGMN